MSKALTTQLWYVARGTGLIDLVLLSIVVALGISARSGRPMYGLPRFGVQAVHRSAALFSVVLLVVHVTFLLTDPYAQLRFIDVLVPFVGTYRPLWQGFGTIAAELLLVLVITSLLRGRIGARTWRAVHWAAYAMWPAALAHGFFNGTDSRHVWAIALYLVCIAIVGAALAWRLSDGYRSATAVRRAPARASSLQGLR
jgi:sulfoxide reductase heme-binding subunit YedZ